MLKPRHLYEANKPPSGDAAEGKVFMNMILTPLLGNMKALRPKLKFIIPETNKILWEEPFTYSQNENTTELGVLWV